LQAVKMLTFYDPVPTQTNVLGSSFRKYPGTCSVTSAVTARKIVTNCKWQYDATGLVLTRKLDGKQYTVTSSNDQELFLTPDLDPLPQVNEEFSYPFVGGANGTSGTILFKSILGGVNDPGTYTAGVLAQAYAVASGSTRAPARFRMGTTPVRVGETVKLRGGIDSALPGQVPCSSINTTNGTITLVVNPFVVNDCVRFFGTIPGSTVASQSYYVVYSFGNDIRVSPTRGGFVLVPSTNPGVATSVGYAVPQGVVMSYSENTFGDYTVAKACLPMTASVVQVVPGNVEITGANPNGTTYPAFCNNDRVRIDQTAGGLLAGVDYWVSVANSGPFTQAIQFSRTPYPALNIVTVNSGLVGRTLTVQDTDTMFYLRRPTTSAVASVAIGASNHITLAEGHYVSAGDKVKFSGASLPGGISASTVYTIASVSSGAAETSERILTLQGVTISSVGSLPITMTQVAGDEFISLHDSHHRFYMERAYQARGSLTGLTITCVTGANAGQTRACGDVVFDAAANKWVLEVSPFVSATAANDTYTIQPPTISGQATPFNKFAMWLPWSPFDGEAQFTQPAFTNLSCSGAGQPITVTFLTDILAANTQVALNGSGRNPLGTSTVSAGSTASVIQCATISATSFAGQVLMFRTGALAGQYRQIASSTTTSVTLVSAFGAVPANGDLFDLVETSVPLEVVYRTSYYVQPTGTLGTLRVDPELRRVCRYWLLRLQQHRGRVHVSPAPARQAEPVPARLELPRTTTRRSVAHTSRSLACSSVVSRSKAITSALGCGCMSTLARRCMSSRWRSAAAALRRGARP
jgi:hypothetical protein